MSNDRLMYFDIDVFNEALTSAVGDMEKAVKTSIRRTVTKTRRYATTLLSTMIREKWNIRKADLDKRIRVSIGNRGVEYDTFELTIKGTSVSLAYFGAVHYMGNRVQTRRSGKVLKRASKFQGVQVEVIKGRRVGLPGTFMKASKTGHLMVMRRKGKERFPVEFKAVITTASIFDQHETDDRFTDAVLAYIERTFAHELDFAITQEVLG